MGRCGGGAKAIAGFAVPDGTALDEEHGVESLVFMVSVCGDEKADASDGPEDSDEMAKHLCRASHVEMARALR